MLTFHHINTLMAPDKVLTTTAKLLIDIKPQLNCSYFESLHSGNTSSEQRVLYLRCEMNVLRQRQVDLQHLLIPVLEFGQLLALCRDPILRFLAKPILFQLLFRDLYAAKEVTKVIGTLLFV